MTLLKDASAGKEKKFCHDYHDWFASVSQPYAHSLSIPSGLGISPPSSHLPWQSQHMGLTEILSWHTHAEERVLSILLFIVSLLLVGFYFGGGHFVLFV